MNCCKPEEGGTQDNGKMLKRSSDSRRWQGPCQRGKKLEDWRTKEEDSWHRKGVWHLAREKMLQDRGALPKEEGDIFREHKAMHEENFPSSWLREDVEDKEESRRKVNEQGDQRRGEQKGKREGEKGEYQTVVKGRCIKLFLRWCFWEIQTGSTSEFVKCAANKYGETVLGVSSSNSSEWNNDDKWSSQVRRTGVHPISICGGTCKMCTDIFLYSTFCLVAGFVYSR